MPGELIPKTIFAMPMGPPFGGMTAYAAMLRGSQLFTTGRAFLFDTTPPVDMGLTGRTAHSLRKLLALLGTVHAKRAEVVYFMTADYLGFYEKTVMALFCRMLGVKTVLHPVGSFVHFYSEAGRRRWLIRFLLRRLSAVVVVQPQVQRYVARLAPRIPVWLIPNPVDSGRFAPIANARRADAPLRILFVGALVVKKGILDLLETVRLRRNDLQGVVVTVVGQGELFAECKRRIADHALDGIVEMRGFVDEPTKAQLLATSDIFCLPSHSEGTPISVLEAMAAGLPIVASNVGGIPLVVTHGSEGWLAAPGDVTALGRVLIDLVRHEGVRRMMGQNAIRRVREQFDINTVAGLFIGCFNELAGAARPTPPGVGIPAMGRSEN